MPSHAAYDDDFYTWTQEQARLLRQLPCETAVPNALDLAHIAEEIEDMGKSELNTVLSLILQMFVHLVKLKTNGLEALPARGWITEILAFYRRVRRGFAPGMRHLIDLEALWREAVFDASHELSLFGEVVPPLPASCPFELDELVAETIDIGVMLDALSPAARETVE